MISLLKNERLFYVGQANLVLKFGAIDILGKIFYPSSLNIKITSHLSSCIMYISSLSNDTQFELYSIIENIAIFDDFFKGKSETIVTYTNEEDIKKDFPHSSILFIPPEWNEFRSIHENNNLRHSKIPKKERNIILVCGPRKVGKSMLAKFISNTILNVKSSCLYLDLDMGQTEFTPPGFFSLSKLSSTTKYLIGPPIRHSHYADKSIFIGSLALDSCPIHCMDAFEALWAAVLESDSDDVCVNTLGWISGLGLSFLQYIVQRMRPTHIISIKSSNTSSPVDDEIPSYVWEAMYEKNNLSSKIVPFTPEEGERVSIASLKTTFERMSHASAVHQLRLLSWKGYFSSHPSFKEIIIPFNKICINIHYNSLLDDFDLTLLLSLLNFATVGISRRRENSISKDGDCYLILDSLMVIKNKKSTDYSDIIAIIKGINPFKKEICLALSPLSILDSDCFLNISFRPGFLIPSNLLSNTKTMISSTPCPYQSSFGSYSSLPQNRRVRNNIIRRSHS